MSTVTLSTVYQEIKSLKKELEKVKYALIPEEKLSAKELAEIKKIEKEMKSGKEKNFEELFNQ